MNHFFDIGANIGQTFDDYLCTSAEYDGWTVWCFEPSPRHLPTLIERANKEGDRYKVKICPFGLWDRVTLLRLWEKTDLRGDSFERECARTNNMPCGYELLVPVMSISCFIMCNTAPEDQITLKIDAEGAEYPILADLLGLEDDTLSLCIFPRLRKIMVEWHECPLSASYEPGDTTKARFQERGLEVEQWMF